MRLLLISSEFPPGPGGIGTHAYQISQQLFRLGWQVSIATSQNYVSETEIATFNSHLPFPLVRFQTKSTALLKVFSRCYDINHWVRTWRPNVLIATGERQVWLTAGLNKLYHLPCVAVGHGVEFGTPLVWRQKLNRWAYQQMSKVVCVSAYTRQRMVGMGIQPHLGIVIPNGADDSQFTCLPDDEIKRVRARHNLQNKRLIITVGNVTKRKGQDIVIRALPHILEQVPNAHYLIVGLPTKQPDFQKLANQLGVAGHVHFMGQVASDTLVQLINCSHVFVMTSRHAANGDFEGYGIAVVEAALCGKPAVVANNSGLAEAIIDGQTGFCVPPEDPVATASAIVNLLKDDSQRARMGKAAKKRALAEQTWANRAKAYDALLRNLVEPEAARATNYPLERVEGA